MQYVALGSSGLKVSRLSFGAMGFGDKAWRSWVLSLDESRPVFRRALEAGITLVDTCDYYSNGRSEEIGLLLLAKGASFAPASADGVARAALHNAALLGHARFLAALLDAGEDVNRADGGGATALHHAARQGHADAVELLLVRGARVDAAGAAGSTPLHEAAHGPIDHRPACGPAPDWARETPHYARAIAALSKAGADPDRADEHGNTPRKLIEANANAEFRAQALAALKP